MGSHKTGSRGSFREQIDTSKLWGLVRVAAVTGLVVGIGLLPIASATGLAVKAGADGFNKPGEFTLPGAPKASTLYASDGKTVIAKFGDQYRVETDADDISGPMKDAIVAVEDSRFYQHNGVDSKSIMRALAANFSSGEVTEGASTLTMQYVRQVLAYTASDTDEADAATATTPERKLREARYALAVEKEKSKEEILTGYLNTVYFGHGAYGVGAAAKVYFGTTADKLTVNQAATLAGLVQSPSRYDPISGDEGAAEKRRDYVLKRMVSTDAITKSEAAKVADRKIPLDPQSAGGEKYGPGGSDYGFFAAYFENWWSKQQAFGDTPQERLAMLSRGGYDIKSSLDANLQQAAESSIAAKQTKQSPFALGSVAVEPGTGQVKVMAVNRDYGSDESKSGETTNPLLTGGENFAGYQAGSTFKLFTMLAALDSGMDLSTSYYSPHRYTSKYVGGSGSSACGQYWCPSNASRSMAGNHNMWSGFGASVNTYFVQLEEAVGAEKAVKMAEKLGIDWNTESDRAQADNASDWGAFTLGVSSTTPMDLAAAYATVAADGEYAKPTPVKSIKDSSGQQIKIENKTKQVIDPQVARAATDAARCPTGYGAAKASCGSGATASQVAGTVGGPVAGKTGTTNDDATAWFSGYSSNLTATSFMADPDNPSNFLSEGMSQLPIGVSADILANNQQSQPADDFTPPQKLVGTPDGGAEQQRPGDGDNDPGEPGDGGGRDGDDGNDDNWPEPGGDDPTGGGNGGDLPGDDWFDGWFNRRFND